MSPRRLEEQLRLALRAERTALKHLREAYFATSRTSEMERRLEERRTQGRERCAQLREDILRARRADVALMSGSEVAAL